VVGKDANGQLTNKLVSTVLEKHQDAYVGECKM
jgi:branched-chain amino acid transport system substrate-binding protein